MVGGATDHHGSAHFILEVVAHHGFHAVHFHGGQEFAVGDHGEAVSGTADAGKSFNVAVPGGDVFVADGPVGTEAIFCIGFKVEVAQAIALSPPHEGAAADMVTADPFKGFYLVVWIFEVIHEELFRDLIVGIAFTLDGGVLVILLGFASTVGQFPWVFFGAHIILDVFHIPAPFNEEGLESFFSQFFGGPSAGDSGTNDDCIKLIGYRHSFLLHEVSECYYCEEGTNLGSSFLFLHLIISSYIFVVRIISIHFPEALNEYQTKEMKYSVKSLFSLFLVIFSLTALSQGKSDINIFELMERRDLRLSEIDVIAKRHFDIVGKVRGTGYKQYERWKYEQQFHLDKNGFILPANYDAQQYAQTSSAMVSAAGAWTELGPTNWTRTTSWNPGVGRITSIAVFPGNQNIIYITSPGGGIWKTTTGGGTWFPLADQNNAMMDMWSVAVDYNDPNLVYASNNSSSFLKSSDGGSTWINKSPGVGPIRKILIDPANNLRLWVVGNSGIASSSDQGNTWVRRSTLSTEDIEFKPGNASIMYATGSSATSAFHRSLDGGVTWTTVGTTQGITNTGRSLVSVSAANPNRVYVVQASGNLFGRMYRSDDGGNTFITTVVGSPTSGTNFFGYETNGSGTTGQASYDMAMTVNPSNADEVHIAGIICWKSTNAGLSYVAETAWSLPNSIGYNHADVHVLEWVGTNIFSGSDGGIYKSSDFGDNWVDLSNGLGIRQFYRISNSKTNASVVTGGAQDNGSSILKSAGWIDWLGADGMDCAISPLNPDVIIGTSQYGSLYRTTNGGSSYSGITEPATGNWVTPLVMESNSNNLYVGWNGVYKSTDLGSTWIKLSGTTITSNLNVLAVSPSNPNYIFASVGSTVYVTKDGGTTWSTYTAPGSVTSFAVHPTNPEKVWISISSTTNRVLVSTDACSTYTNISSNLPALAARSVVVDNSSEEGLYVGMNIGVYYTNKNLTSWINLTDNLPQVAINEVELQISGGKLRAGTYGRGLWERSLYSTCGIPSGLSSSNVTISTARLSWVGSADAVSYSVEYKLASASTWTILPSQTSTVVDLSGLNAGSNYDWRVAVNCNAGMGAYAGSAFTTAIVCNAPTGLNSGIPTSNSTTLSWSAVTGASSYDIDILPTGGSWTSRATGLTTTSFNLTGLTANTGYTWRVRANCGTLSGYSGYAQSTFTTPIQACVDAYEANNTLTAAKTIAPRTSITALISTNTDLDHFKISMGSNTKIRVTLSNMPAAYDVQILNSKGVLQQTGTTTSAGTKVVFFNGTLTKQTYFIRVSGISGAFNATTCYTLFVENGTANYTAPAAPEFSSSRLPLSNINELNSFKVYPVPAKKMINLVYPSTKNQRVTVQFVDAIGRVVKVFQAEALQGVNTWQFSLDGLNRSLYYLVITDSDKRSDKKAILVD